MLKKQFRLPGGQRLSALTSRRTPYVLLKIARNDLSFSRFGFVIGKRTDKRATERNRLRRALVSMIDEKLVSIKPGYDMLFIVQAGAVGKTSSELRAHVLKILTEETFL